MVHSRRVTVARPPALGFHIAGEALDAGAPGLEHAQLMLLAPGGELTQVESVSLPGRAGVAGQEPSQRQLLLSAEYRLGDGDRGGRG
jgi:hypothetical protein